MHRTTTGRDFSCVKVSSNREPIPTMEPARNPVRAATTPFCFSFPVDRLFDRMPAALPVNHWNDTVF